jgi:hypothetical protein
MSAPHQTNKMTTRVHLNKKNINLLKKKGKGVVGVAAWPRVNLNG